MQQRSWKPYIRAAVAGNWGTVGSCLAVSTIFWAACLYILLDHEFVRGARHIPGRGLGYSNPQSFLHCIQSIQLRTLARKWKHREAGGVEMKEHHQHEALEVQPHLQQGIEGRLQDALLERSFDEMGELL